MKYVLLILMISSLVVVSGCNCDKPETASLSKDVRWVRQSAEFKAITTQTYRMAWQVLKADAKKMDSHWAVSFDVDETVLDNSRYQEILFERGIRFPEYWNDWCLEKKCPPVAGAKAFIDSLRSLGEFAHMAFITNRDESVSEATKENLINVGLWQDGDVLLCRLNKADSKEIRRQEVINGTGRCADLGKRQIIALFGDQLGDMEEVPKLDGADAYIAHYQNHPQWG